MKEILVNTQTKIIIALSVLMIILIILFFVFFRKDIDDKSLDQELNINQLSYNKSQYYSFADAIEMATNTAGDDEELIYSVFERLNNDSDYLMLKKAFGKRSYLIGFVGWFYNATLNEVLTEKLDSSEIEKINGILADKNISYYI